MANQEHLTKWELADPPELGWIPINQTVRLELIETMDIAPLTGPEDLPRAA